MVHVLNQNIVLLLNILGNQNIYIIFIFLSGGTLYDYMKSTSINFSWEQVIKFSQVNYFFFKEY